MQYTVTKTQNKCFYDKMIDSQQGDISAQSIDSFDWYDV